MIPKYSFSTPWRICIFPLLFLLIIPASTLGQRKVSQYVLASYNTSGLTVNSIWKWDNQVFSTSWCSATGIIIQHHIWKAWQKSHLALQTLQSAETENMLNTTTKTQSVESQCGKFYRTNNLLELIISQASNRNNPFVWFLHPVNCFKFSMSYR